MDYSKRLTACLILIINSEMEKKRCLFEGSWLRVLIWVALRKSFHLCRLKDHENLKPQPERKTFRMKNRDSHLWEIIVSKGTRFQGVYPRAFERRYYGDSPSVCSAQSTAVCFLLLDIRTMGIPMFDGFNSDHDQRKKSKSRKNSSITIYLVSSLFDIFMTP